MAIISPGLKAYAFNVIDKIYVFNITSKFFRKYAAEVFSLALTKNLPIIFLVVHPKITYLNPRLIQSRPFGIRSFTAQIQFRRLRSNLK